MNWKIATFALGLINVGLMAIIGTVGNENKELLVKGARLEAEKEGLEHVIDMQAVRLAEHGDI